MKIEPICPPECHEHTSSFADFDHFCDAAEIQPGEEPAAFAAWLNALSGWDGKCGPPGGVVSEPIIPTPPLERGGAAMETTPEEWLRGAQELHDLRPDTYDPYDSRDPYDDED